MHVPAHVVESTGGGTVRRARINLAPHNLFFNLSADLIPLDM